MAKIDIDRLKEAYDKTKRPNQIDMIDYMLRLNDMIDMLYRIDVDKLSDYDLCNEVFIAINEAQVKTSRLFLDAPLKKMDA